MQEARVLTWKAFSRVVLLQALVILVLVAMLGVAVNVVFKNRYLRETEKQAEEFLNVLATDLPAKPTDAWCTDYASGTPFRVTALSSKDGTVLCDSMQVSQRMTPLLEREEIAEALRSPNHRGSSHRKSYTLKEDALYSALYLVDRDLVVRAGTKLSFLREILRVFDLTLLIGLVVFTLTLLALLQWSSKHLVMPLATGIIERRTQDLREDFVANVSHELRTPLTSIKGFADTLLLDADEGKAADREFLKIIARNASRLLTLINDLLDLSALDAKGGDIQKIPVRVRELTEGAARQLEGAFKDKPHTVRVVCDLDEVSADPERLEQVIVNLISNARKYTPAGGVIEVNWSKEPDGTALFKVTDNGPGIAREHHGRLFERFYRVDAGRGRDEGGTGLGLSIVKHIMDLHGGSLGVESTVGQGATFWCRFPHQS